MEYNVTVFDNASDDPEEHAAKRLALEKFNKTKPVALPGEIGRQATRRVYAERCRDFLRKAGITPSEGGYFDTRPLKDRGFGEESAQWIAAEWLAAHNRLTYAGRKIEAGGMTPEFLELALEAAEELGRQHERMIWRAGIDPTTGERRERLSVERRDQRLAFANASAERAAANAERQEAGRALVEIAQRIADDYWSRNPGASKLRVAAHVADRWPADCGIPRPTKNTIRQRIEKT